MAFPTYDDIDNLGDVPAAALLFGVRNPLSATQVLAAAEIDPMGPWLVTIDTPHHQIHEGEQFTFQEVIQLGSAGTQDYILTVPAATFPHFGYKVDGIYGVTIEMFTGTGFTQSAAASTVFNRNMASAKTPGMTIKKGHDAGSGDGTRFVWRKAGSGTSAGKLQGSASEASERILNASTHYLFRITSAAASNDISVEFDWYEEGAD